MPVKTVVGAITQAAGTYTIPNYALSPLIKGTYTLRVNLLPTAGGLTQTASVKLLIK